MGDGGRGYEDGGAWRKLNNSAGVPEHQVAAAFGVKGPERCDAAPSEGEVCRVGVFEASRVGPEVERGGSPYAVFERTACGLVAFEEGL